MKITNDYCNGFFGRRWDLYGAKIEAIGEDWVVIRFSSDETAFASFKNKKERKDYIKQWTIKQTEEDGS